MNATLDRRFVAIVALIASLAVAIGFAGVDRVIAEAMHGSALADARVFDLGLGALDTISGLAAHAIWLAGIVAIILGIVLAAMKRRDAGTAFVVSGATALATVEAMILAKDFFGRLRPYEVLASGDWSHVWFAGGGSFPSGHSAFYFGLLLPLSAFAKATWLRAILIAIPLFAIAARIDLEKHFLSDVSASVVLAAAFATGIDAIARASRRRFATA